MKTVKKIMSVIMIGTLITSQIGCAGKVTKISEPMDQVKFDKDYKYTVQIKGGSIISNVEGADIVSKKNNLVLKTKTSEKSVMNQDIKQINGVHNARDGSYALRGMVVGAASVGFVGGLMGIALSGFGAIGCESDSCIEASSGNPALGFLVVGAAGAAVGGLFGLGIGALIPKHKRIQITPIVEPTKTGSINAGANLGVTF